MVRCSRSNCGRGAHFLTALQKIPFLEKRYIKNIPASDNVSLLRVLGEIGH